MHHIALYLKKDPTYADIRSIFAGLRPLIKEGDNKNTAVISREHHVSVSDSELITIAGGKWTTYRKMAEDALEIAEHKAGLGERECITKTLHIHGYEETKDFKAPLILLWFGRSKNSGIDQKVIRHLAEPIHPGYAIYQSRNSLGCKRRNEHDRRRCIEQENKGLIAGCKICDGSSAACCRHHGEGNEQR